MTSSNELFSLSNKTALVTGASRGIGARIAQVLDGAGARVTLVARDQEKLEAVAAGLTNEATVVPADLTDPGAPERVRDAVGHVDILVNNAGMSKAIPSTELSLEDWDQIQALNTRSYFLMSRTFAPAMLESGGGKIVNVSSFLAFQGEANGAAYITSKAALMGMTRSLGIEWARKNVCVNALCPGFIATDLVAEIRANPKFEERIVRRTPMRRFGEVDDLDGAILFLASGASDFMTGQSLVVDGGLTAGW